ncbi:hypothetical protein TNIN_166991 [Trichonephila inaurata madagascariensis]|uniref:Uncharacterized protein n=1 Tax=Trichonephila inaurata madagascariensis TaxID=2747483 RepID=A0A8X6XKF1_9ARAC|nr:hypothetical protein TNIN_166991 [Trichonephila inaurata madagascariensis]
MRWTFMKGLLRKRFSLPLCLIKGEKVSKRREWSSDSFSSSLKEVKRVIQKTPRPSKTTKTITSAEIHKKEESQSQTGQEQPASKPYHLRVTTKRSNIPILASGQEKSPSKPELVTKRTLTFPKYLSRQEKSSYDGSSVKRSRVTVKHFESVKSPSKPEFSPVVRGRSKIPLLASGKEQPASKPEHSRVRKGRSKIHILAYGYSPQ